MPAEKLVPYRCEMYERRNKDNKYNQAQLYNYDTGFPDNNIIDVLQAFFSTHEGSNLELPSSDKTLVVEEYSRDGNLIEGVLSTGYHGYRAELRHVESGDLTHVKDQDEAEQMPLYFLAYLPETVAGEPYDNGEGLFMVMQQVNRTGIKTKLTEHLEQHILRNVSNTTMRIDPVGTEEVLQKVLDAERVTKVDLNVRRIPGDDESRYEIVEGMDQEEIETQSLIFRPEHGGSFRWVKNLATRARDSDVNFVEFIQDDVENFTVTIQNDQGRSESFSLMTEEIAMRKDLDDSLPKEDGLITAAALRSETNELMADVLNPNIVQALDGSTGVER